VYQPAQLYPGSGSPVCAAVRRETDRHPRAGQPPDQAGVFPTGLPGRPPESLISQRHGRTFIPIKATTGRHSRSSTTSPRQGHLYLEPLAIVEHNNALNLCTTGKAGRRSVLRRLTDLVRNHLDEIVSPSRPWANWTPSRPGSDLPRSLGPVSPSGGSGGADSARPAPLLVQQRRETIAAPTCPVDLSLTSEHRFLIISGANAGARPWPQNPGPFDLMPERHPIPVDEAATVPLGRFSPTSATPRPVQSLSTFSAT